MYYYDSPCYHCYFSQKDGGYRFTADYVKNLVGNYVNVDIPGYNIINAYIVSFDDRTGTVYLTILTPYGYSDISTNYQNIQGIRPITNVQFTPTLPGGGMPGGAFTSGL